MTSTTIEATIPPIDVKADVNIGHADTYNTQIIQNNNITINPAAKATGGHHVVHHRGPQKALPKPHSNWLLPGSHPTGVSVSGPFTDYDNEGHKVVTYKDSIGGSAQYVLNRDGTTETFTLRDSHGAIQTFGAARDYQHIGQRGDNEQSTEHHHNWYDPREWFSSYFKTDTLHCGLQAQGITSGDNESISIDKLKGFADRHDKLAGQLDGVKYAVTTVDDHAADFNAASHTPAMLSACPLHKR